MRVSRLVLSDVAASDILEQADWYAAHVGSTLAERWDKAITSALLRVIRNPAAGSPCRFRSPELNDVRRIAIRGFPKHLLFYRFCKQEVLVLRIVHGARDLERLL